MTETVRVIDGEIRINLQPFIGHESALRYAAENDRQELRAKLWDTEARLRDANDKILRLEERFVIEHEARLAAESATPETERMKMTLHSDEAQAALLTGKTLVWLSNGVVISRIVPIPHTNKLEILTGDRTRGEFSPIDFTTKLWEIENSLPPETERNEE